jgi:hypothetical protein
LIPPTLSDKDKLDDTYNVEMLVRKTRQAHTDFDMHAVFTAVIPDRDDPTGMKITSTTKDLYKDFARISIEEVANSNAWYRQWPKSETYAENLKLTYNFFQNNVEDDLFEKVFEQYDGMKQEQKGGPLFFIIMMNILLSHTEEAALALNERGRKFKLTILPGENVDKAVSLLRGALKRLKSIDKIPQDIIRVLIAVMQTSSVEEVNATFTIYRGALDRDRATQDRRKGDHASR